MTTPLTPDEWIAKYDNKYSIYNISQEDPFAKKAREIWDKTPTPLYDEFMSKRKANDYSTNTPGMKEDELLFWEYVKKLIIKYATSSPSDIRRSLSVIDGCGHAQALASDGGKTHYSRFRDTEKALDVSQVYKFPPPPPPSEAQLMNMYRGGHQYVPPPQRQYSISINPWMDLRNILFETYYNHTAPAREEARKVAEAARIRAEEARRLAENTARVAAEEKAKNAALIIMYDL